MSAITDLALSPFAWLFRLSYANPLIAIIASAGAGLLALVTGHENWMAALVSFSAYILIWWDESQAPAAEPSAEAE